MRAGNSRTQREHGGETGKRMDNNMRRKFFSPPKEKKITHSSACIREPSVCVSKESGLHCTAPQHRGGEEDGDDRPRQRVHELVALALPTQERQQEKHKHKNTFAHTTYKKALPRKNKEKKFARHHRDRQTNRQTDRRSDRQRTDRTDSDVDCGVDKGMNAREMSL